MWYEFDKDKVQDSENLIKENLYSLLNGFIPNPTKRVMLFEIKTRQELTGNLNLKVSGMHVRFSKS